MFESLKLAFGHAGQLLGHALACQGRIDGRQALVQRLKLQRAGVRLVAERGECAFQQHERTLGLCAVELADKVLVGQLGRLLEGFVGDLDAVVFFKLGSAAFRDFAQGRLVGLLDFHQRKVVADVGVRLEDLGEVGVTRLENRLQVGRAQFAHQGVDNVGDAVVAGAVDEPARVFDDQYGIGVALEGCEGVLEGVADFGGIAESEERVGIEPVETLADDVEGCGRIFLAGLEALDDGGDAHAGKTGQKKVVAVFPHQDVGDFFQLGVASDKFEIRVLGEELGAADKVVAVGAPVGGVVGVSHNSCSFFL